MSPLSKIQLGAWRWVLIVSEVLVVGYMALLALSGRHALPPTGTALVIGVFAGIACLFLLFGSPFLVRSHGGLAIAGWCIGAAALCISSAL
ncbi:MAG TPA: hypothetical protein VMS21_07110 [Methylomirabilota bacterium]|nr:hypothetical protein [Methylomirabilota bacterium]